MLDSRLGCGSKETPGGPQVLVRFLGTLFWPTAIMVRSKSDPRTISSSKSHLFVANLALFFCFWCFFLGGCRWKFDIWLSFDWLIWVSWRGLALLVASLRPQLAELSCDAAGSGHWASSAPSWGGWGMVARAVRCQEPPWAGRFFWGEDRCSKNYVPSALKVKTWLPSRHSAYHRPDCRCFSQKRARWAWIHGCFGSNIKQARVYMLLCLAKFSKPPKSGKPTDRQSMGLFGPNYSTQRRKTVRTAPLAPLSSAEELCNRFLEAAVKILCCECSWCRVCKGASRGSRRRFHVFFQIFFCLVLMFVFDSCLACFVSGYFWIISGEYRKEDGLPNLNEIAFLLWGAMLRLANRYDT